VIFVIDTSSALSAIALLDGDRVVHGEVGESGPRFDLPARYKAVSKGRDITRIAVAVGPGSFTGLRAGVSFGLGVAMGLNIPIVPLPTLWIQAARSDESVLAVAEAGRGRVYYLAPGAEPGVAEPLELPRDWPLAGWLRPQTQAALKAVGLRFKADGELATFGTAAARLLQSAPEVAYGSLKVEYMQSFSARTN
jgi:tRNA threonylcarbamoyl adenosine modification protein YeaZ